MLVRKAKRWRDDVNSKPRDSSWRAASPDARHIEALEVRALLSASVEFHSDLVGVSPGSGVVAHGSTAPYGLTPTQVRHAYGIDAIRFGSVAGDGSGQTIAIIGVYHSPTIGTDLTAFDAALGVAAPPSLVRVAQDGSTNYPSTDPAAGTGLTWAAEAALDVEWAHAVAPGANLLLVEASSAYDSDILAAIDYARRQPGVSAVSMSFGGAEDPSQSTWDSTLATPAGHAGVTFLASTGDSGAYDTNGDFAPEFPATSPSVVAVGGTTLSAGSDGTYYGESGWSDGGGGVSSIEAQPGYQQGVVTQSTTRRATPDVAFDANPSSGVPVYDSFDNGTAAPWVSVGGTSFSAPAWAGLVAIADQGRATAGLSSLDGATETLPRLYALPASDFHDVTGGSNGYAAGAGYDLVTGRGTPRADLLVPALAGVSSTPSPTPTPTPVIPANNNFAAAAALSGTSATATGSNANATKEASEPSHGGNVGGASVWYKWTAPAAGTTTVSLAGSTFNTLLGVYTGASVGALTAVAGNDNASAGDVTSKASFTAAAGTTYYIAVDGYNAGSAAAAGTVKLALAETVATVTKPANDNFASATLLSGSSVAATGTNVNATKEANETKIVGNVGGHSVWYRWIATGTGTTTISLAGSTFDTLLGVFTGTSAGALSPIIGSNDYGTAKYSRVTFRAVKGTTYRIVVDGYNAGAGAASGTIKLALAAPVTAAVRAAASPALSLDPQDRNERDARSIAKSILAGQG